MALTLLVLASCSQRRERPVITVAVPAQASLLREIAGDNYEVNILVKGGDAESFSPSVADISRLRESEAYMKIGNIAFEEAILDRLGENGDSLLIVDTGAGIVPVGGEEEPDPHVWLSLRNLRIMASNMTEALCGLDPADAQLFRLNLGRLTARIDSLDRLYDRRLAGHEGASFVVWHPSLSYFARDYGLRQIAVGGAEHKETSIPGMNRRISEAAEAGAVLMVMQPGADSRHTDAVNSRLNLPVVEFNPLASDWQGEFDRLTNALAR